MPSGKPTGRICHVRAASAGGPRYDPAQTREERHSFDNLILLCPVHHDVIDSDVEAYSVERLLAMKHDHEVSNGGGAEPPEEIARALIEVSSVRVGTGAVLLAVGVSTGQVAQTITNVFGSTPARFVDAAAAKFHDKRLEICGELWQLLGRAQSAVYRVASAFRQIRNVDHVPDAEFRQFVTSSAFNADEKRRLMDAEDRTKVLSEVSWASDLRDARQVWRELHNYANTTRIYLSDSLKAQVSQAAGLISRIITHCEIAQTEENLNFESTLSWLRQLDKLLIRIEELMSTEIRGA